MSGEELAEKLEDIIYDNELTEEEERAIEEAIDFIKEFKPPF
ncbi:hypothetical protein SAMN06265827_10590 [Orenia metallireducens]|uniref:Uncharacterized protein n=1 Tax=Orenia metallireducens TaxID=1413210 RepID=A0A285G9Q9_9FIRM|nr:hypothetical protein [Orenia metallireducens]SNY19266.1 hypothetical protein SAMN06265827_10590 [Orenia metallireducens]